MSELFGKKPTVDKGAQRAQRRQNKSIDDKAADEARTAGSRRRLANQRKASGGLFAQTGAAGVKKETLG